jgi:ParB family chromosome partitioning protein
MVKRKALGKGLSALIPEANHTEERDGRFFQCPIESIEPNPYQPRQDFSDAELDEMAQSIREKGILAPLLVSKSESGYQLIAGERRWRAAQRAALTHIPVVIREATPSESLELALIENIHRKDLNPIEEALAYSKLLEDTGITQDTLAKRVGKDRSTITNLLRLLKLPLPIQKDVIDGHLSMGHARVIAGLDNAEKQIAIRDLIKKKALSVRQLEALAKKDAAPHRARKGIPQKDAYLNSLVEDLKKSLGTKVDIIRRGKEGRIVVYFYSDEELDRLLDILG